VQVKGRADSAAVEKRVRTSAREIRLGVVPARFLPFLLASVIVILIPGPDTLVVLRNALLAGKRTAARTALGVLTGLSVWVTAAALGLTAVLRASHDGYIALRIAGAIYLTYFGLQALRSRALGQAVGVPAPKGSLIGRGYRAGLMTDLLNPKVGVFFITFMPAFIPHRTPVAASTFGMGTVFVLLTGLYFAVMLAFVPRLLGWLRNERYRRRLNRATGLVLIGFGARLAIDR
jgi:threonine/homoserine/homoserine lactone efflux protein